MSFTELVGRGSIEAIDLSAAVGARLTPPPREEKQRKSAQIDSHDWEEPATCSPTRSHQYLARQQRQHDQMGGTPHVWTLVWEMVSAG